MSIFDGVSRPMRATGLGLLAVAVVAAAIGGITLVSGDDEPDHVAATSSAEPTRGEKDREKSGDSSPKESDDTGDEAGDADPDSENSDSADSTDADGSDDGEVEDQPISDDSVPVRVYNNSTIGGLAAEVREDLAARGWNVVEIGNYSAGNIPTSTVYFRPGTDEESAARALAEDFGMRVEPRFDGIADASPGVIVIVTKDYEEPRGGK